MSGGIDRNPYTHAWDGINLQGCSTSRNFRTGKNGVIGMYDTDNGFKGSDSIKREMIHYALQMRRNKLYRARPHEVATLFFNRYPVKAFGRLAASAWNEAVIRDGR